MHGEGQSTVLSKTSNSVEQASRIRSITSGELDKLDCVFPVFDVMYKKVHSIPIISWICSIIFILQNIFISFWVFNMDNFDFTKLPDQILAAFIYFIFGFNPQNASEPHYTTFYIGLAVCILTIIFLVFSIGYYIKFSSTNLFLLCVLRIFLEDICLIMIMPSFICGGQCLIGFMFKDGPGYFLVFTIVSVLLSLFFVGIYSFNNRLTCSSPFITKNHRASFDCAIMNNTAYLLTATTIISFITKLFPAWLTCMFAFIHVVGCIVIIYSLFKLPFIHFYYNVLIASTLTAASACNITRAIQIAIINIWDCSALIVSIGIFIISAIIYHFVFKAIKSKAEAVLLPGQDDEIGKNEDYLSDHGIGQSVKHFIFYYISGLACASPFFIDMSLMRYGLDYFPESSEIFKILTLTTAFFPSLSRPLNIAFNRLVKKPQLAVDERFLLFEVHRVKLLRQSSGGSAFTEKLAAVKQETKQCLSYIHGFWMQTPDSANAFGSLNKILTRTTSHWMEFTYSYPNSVKTFDEYSTYLIECRTDFAKAAIQHHFMELLEEGHRLHKDVAFRSLIRTYPFYLRKGYCDFKGNLKDINRVTNNGGTTQSSSSGKSMSNSTISVDDDIELGIEEEDIHARTIVHQHKLRLAFQKSIAGKQASCAHATLICIITSFIASVVILLITHFIFSTFFSQREDAIQENNALNQARFYQSYARLANWLNLARGTNRFVRDEIYDQYLKEDIIENNNLDFFMDLQIQSIYYQQLGSNEMSKFVQFLVSDATNGKNIYHYARSFITSEVNYTVCKADSSPLPKKHLSTMTTLYALMSVFNSRLFYRKFEDWTTDKILCEIVNLINPMSNGYIDIYTLGLDVELDVTRSNGYIIDMYMYIVPVVLSVINIAITSISFGEISRELRTILKAFKEAPTSFKEEACETIRKNNDEEEQTKSFSSIPIGCSYGWYFVLLDVLAIVPGIFILIMANLASQTNTGFEYITDWMNLAGCRPPFVSEVLEHLTLAILLRDSTKFCSLASEKKLTELSVLIVDTFNKEVLQGGEVRSIAGFDDKLDDIHFKDICEMNSTSKSQHEKYRCASLEQTFALFKTMVDTAVANLGTITDLNNPLVFDIYHLANAHLFDRLLEVNQRLQTIGTTYNSEFITNSRSIMAIGIIGSAIILLVEIIVFREFCNMYNAVKVLIRRVQPIQLLSNKQILNLFLADSKSKTQKGGYTFSQNIIFNSEDGALFLSKGGIIELVNPSVQSILGYVPDQILGQSITQLFNNPDKITKQLGMMKNGESGDLYVGNDILVTDSMTQLQCAITIVGMRNVIGDLSSYVIFFRDESEIIQKQKFAEESKAKSEELLYQILPRDVVNKLNMGEKDITIVIPCATVMFIDIVKFSDYASHLTPQQIMGNLSMIFDAFDKALTRYDMITKIKLIGDVYMCAAGLFSPDAPPATHAEQMVRFALDCLSEIEGVNTQLESFLTVRIGINTGGPLIAGILGTDKPIFDIIGDPINVAARLQSTSLSGKIQIPESTYELVKGIPDFFIESRGEVYLKGKGNTNTYLISPHAFIRQTNTLTDLSEIIFTARKD